ncbi:MAG: YIP1 family protein [Candidatus Obscuribacterales bacterium]|nr:YIP1 family protein [Candidatus Obscuribacterales bacterium]
MFTPQAFFKQLRGQYCYRDSMLYLAKTSFVVSAVNALLVTLVFYVLASSFVSILSTFMVIVGTLLTPLIAVAANLPPEKVPGAVAALAKDGGTQVLILSAKLLILFFISNCCTIIASTCLLAGISHGITRLLGGPGSFRATAASYAFASAAWTLSSIPVVNLLAPIYGAVLDIIAMRELHEISRAKAITAVTISALIPLIALILLN